MTATKWTIRLMVGSILALGAFSSLPAQAQTYNLFIQPIQVRSSDGSTGASIGASPTDDYFQNEVSKIFAQANIKVFFDPLAIYNNSLFTTTTTDNTQLNSFDHLVNDAGHGQNADATVLNLFFVNSLADTEPGDLYGLGKLGANGVVINGDLVSSFNPPYGRIDTVAHEIGHNFGLDHDTFGAGATSPDGVGADNLMTSGSDRAIPNTLADINPDGLGLDKLTAAQIAEAQSVGLANGFLKVAAVPEASTTVSFGLLLALGMGGVMVAAKRKKTAVKGS